MENKNYVSVNELMAFEDGSQEEDKTVSASRQFRACLAIAGLLWKSGSGIDRGGQN